MFRFTQHKFLSAILAAGMLATSALVSTPAQAEMTKEDVEKIIEEYLRAHGDVIMESVDHYQRVGIKERQAAALQQNKAEIYENERSPYIGKVDGDVVVVEFFDYNCGYCKKVFDDLSALAKEDKNVKIVFKELPILGASSQTAAKWALAAQKQKKYFEFHAALMSNKTPINEELLMKISKDLGMDAGQAKKDAESTDVLLQLEKNRALATALNIGGTPAFLVGDDITPGAVTKDSLKKKIAAQREAMAAEKEDKKEKGEAKN